MPLRPPFRQRPLLALLMLSPALALAAEKNPTQFDTVTVTATRNEQSIGSVPSTVSVVDARQIDQQQIKNSKDLIRYEPGVSVSGSGSRFALLHGLTGRGQGGLHPDRIRRGVLALLQGTVEAITQCADDTAALAEQIQCLRQ